MDLALHKCCLISQDGVKALLKDEKFSEERPKSTLVVSYIIMH